MDDRRHQDARRTSLLLVAVGLVVAIGALGFVLSSTSGPGSPGALGAVAMPPDFTGVVVVDSRSHTSIIQGRSWAVAAGSVRPGIATLFAGDRRLATMHLFGSSQFRFLVRNLPMQATPFLLVLDTGGSSHLSVAAGRTYTFRIGPTPRTNSVRGSVVA